MKNFLFVQKEHNKDTPFLGIPKFGERLTIRSSIIADVTAEAQSFKQTAFTCVPHIQIIEALLKQIEKINFKEYAGFADDDENAKLRKAHFLIITCERILEVANRNKWGLCRRYSFFYTYNGAFWRLLDKDDLKAFLKQAAERLGINRF